MSLSDRKPFLEIINPKRVVKEENEDSPFPDANANAEPPAQPAELAI
jgi:hypothetical protein